MCVRTINLYTEIITGRMVSTNCWLLSWYIHIHIYTHARFCHLTLAMGLLPDMLNCGLPLHGKCRERFPRLRLQRKPLVSDPGMYHGTCVTHLPWCMSGSLTRSAREDAPGIPGACATRNFTYLARGPWRKGSKPVSFFWLVVGSYHWLGGKLWCLQHYYVGDIIVIY